MFETEEDNATKLQRRKKRALCLVVVGVLAAASALAWSALDSQVAEPWERIIANWELKLALWWAGVSAVVAGVLVWAAASYRLSMARRDAASPPGSDRRAPSA
jgi:heme/copper-type cytochrome/quinol oxidase subunit 2